MKTTVERVREICKKKQISVSKLEQDLGFGNGFLNPKKVKDIKARRVLAIANYLEVPLSEILGAEQNNKGVFNEDRMSSVERIKSICRERKIPISRLERDLGFSNAYISQLRKGVMPAERLYLIADYLNVSPSFLLYGDKKELTPEFESELSEKDIRLIQWFRSLPQGKQKAILESQDAPEGLV